MAALPSPSALRTQLGGHAPADTLYGPFTAFRSAPPPYSEPAKSSPCRRLHATQLPACRHSSRPLRRVSPPLVCIVPGQGDTLPAYPTVGLVLSGQQLLYLLRVAPGFDFIACLVADVERFLPADPGAGDAAGGDHGRATPSAATLRASRARASTRRRCTAMLTSAAPSTPGWTGPRRWSRSCRTSPRRCGGASMPARTRRTPKRYSLHPFRYHLHWPVKPHVNA